VRYAVYFTCFKRDLGKRFGKGNEKGMSGHGIGRKWYEVRGAEHVPKETRFCERVW